MKFCVTIISQLRWTIKYANSCKEGDIAVYKIGKYNVPGVITGFYNSVNC